MAYIKSAYADQDHFTCERVLAFRSRFQRSSSQPAEQAPTVTGDAGKDEKSGTFMMVKPTESAAVEDDKIRRTSWQQFKGSSDQLQEVLKKRGGKLTDEDLLRIEGSA